MTTKNQNQDFFNQAIEEHPRRTAHEINQTAVVNTEVPEGDVADDLPGVVSIDPVIALPTFTTVNDTPTQALGGKDVNLGTDGAEHFQLKPYRTFSNPIDRTTVIAGGGNDFILGTIVMPQVKGGNGNDTIYGRTVTTKLKEWLTMVVVWTGGH